MALFPCLEDQSYQFGDYIEIENYINDKIQRISGIVIKDYGTGSCFIRVTKCSNLQEFSMRGWGKFSIKNDEGYYYSPSTIKSKGGHTRAFINNQSTSVVEYHTQINKTVNEKYNGNLSCQAYSKYLTTLVVTCPDDNLTFVYLQDKDIGAWSRGTSEESKKLAAYRALIKYYTNLERSIREPK